MNKIKTVISENRKKLGLTQKELALKLNVSDKQVSKWETGVSYPDITIISRIAKVLEITVNDLLEDDNLEKSNNTEYNYVFKTRILRNLAISISTLIIGIIVFYAGLNSFKDELITILTIISIISIIFSITWFITTTIAEVAILQGMEYKVEYRKLLYFKNILYLDVFIGVFLIVFIAMSQENRHEIIDFTNESISFLASIILILLFFGMYIVIRRKFNLKSSKRIFSLISFILLFINGIVVSIFSKYTILVISFIFLVVLNVVTNILIKEK